MYRGYDEAALLFNKCLNCCCTFVTSEFIRHTTGNQKPSVGDDDEYQLLSIPNMYVHIVINVLLRLTAPNLIAA
eukprot:scaffold9963_cov19-Prasinocladus_malaysianus.AAC.1